MFSTIMITLNLFFFNPIKKSPLLALLNLKRFEISPKNGWRARERGDEPTEAFPNWRYVFENIRTDFINGLGGRNSPRTPLPPALP